MKVKINIDMYSMDLTVVTSFDEFKEIHLEAREEVPFVTVEKGQSIFVLVSDEWGSMYDHRFIQCLSHEMNHAAICMLSYVGVKFDYNNQEALCYLQDYFMATIFKEINKNHKKQLKLMTSKR